MPTSDLEQFIKLHKNYDDLQAKKAAYQVRLFGRTILYSLGFAILFYFLGYLKECVILFLFYKLYRGNAGGIHLKGHISCFLYSFLLLFATVQFARYIPLLPLVEIALALFILVTWYVYVPQGTSQRPIRRTNEKKHMKNTMLLYIILTFLLRFFNQQLYALGLWSLTFTLLMILPIVYNLFQVKHDRI